MRGAEVAGAEYTWRQCRDKAYNLGLLATTEEILPPMRPYFPGVSPPLDLTGLRADIKRGDAARPEFAKLTVAALYYLCGFVFNVGVPLIAEINREALTDALATAGMPACDPNDFGAEVPRVATLAFYRALRASVGSHCAVEKSVDAAERALGPPKVTVEPDPDARGTFPNDPNGSGDASAGLRMVLGVSAADRPGLLHDISQGLNRLRVQLLHCEASAVAERSVSIWRLQAMDASTTREQIKTVIEALLSPVSGADAEKRKGARVARALVPAGSSLLGRTPAEVGFRKTYGAAIVGMQRQGRRPSGRIGQVRLREGDELVLQLADGSPLLEPAPSEEELEKHGVAPRVRADDEDKDHPASHSLSRGGQTHCRSAPGFDPTAPLASTLAADRRVPRPDHAAAGHDRRAGTHGYQSRQFSS